MHFLIYASSLQLNHAFAKAFIVLLHLSFIACFQVVPAQADKRVAALKKAGRLKEAGELDPKVKAAHACTLLGSLDDEDHTWEEIRTALHVAFTQGIQIEFDVQCSATRERAISFHACGDMASMARIAWPGEDTTCMEWDHQDPRMCALIAQLDASGPDYDAMVKRIYEDIWKCYNQDNFLGQLEEPTKNIEELRLFFRCMCSAIVEHPLPAETNLIRVLGSMQRKFFMGLGGFSFMSPYEIPAELEDYLFLSLDPSTPLASQPIQTLLTTFPALTPLINIVRESNYWKGVWRERAQGFSAISAHKGAWAACKHELSTTEEHIDELESMNGETLDKEQPKVFPQAVQGFITLTSQVHSWREQFWSGATDQMELDALGLLKRMLLIAKSEDDFQSLFLLTEKFGHDDLAAQIRDRMSENRGKDAQSRLVTMLAENQEGALFGWSAVNSILGAYRSFTNEKSPQDLPDQAAHALQVMNGTLELFSAAITGEDEKVTLSDVSFRNAADLLSFLLRCESVCAAAHIALTVANKEWASIQMMAEQAFQLLVGFRIHSFTYSFYISVFSLLVSMLCIFHFTHFLCSFLAKALGGSAAASSLGGLFFIFLATCLWWGMGRCEMFPLSSLLACLSD